MILVTGGAGMIGSNYVKHLNNQGIHDIIVCDDLEDGKKVFNINDLKFKDYVDSANLFHVLSDDKLNLTKVVHLGACSDTTEWNGKFVMQNNFEFSKVLFHYCTKKQLPFVYASSASVYGMGELGFSENTLDLKPINMYAFSKYFFDRYVYSSANRPNTCVGLRFFNVFGPREQHKGKMSSVMYHFYQQAKHQRVINLFGETKNYSAGEQRRDFIYVKDCVKMIDDSFRLKGTFLLNCGTGKAHTYNEVYLSIKKWFQQRHGIDVKCNYIHFPSTLENSYQEYTQADNKLKDDLGIFSATTDFEEAIFEYMDTLESVASV